MPAAEEDEWEYEYDDNETEHFYITLDLSNVPEKTNKPAPAKPVQAAIGNPTLLQSRLRLLGNASRGGENAAEVLDGQGSQPFSKMQITGLHTSNPLIMYNDQLLSCTWASTIGTDLFFVKPHPSGGNQDAPLRSLPAVDLLALGSARLMATGARLQPREEVYSGASASHAELHVNSPDVPTGTRAGIEAQEGSAEPVETRKAPTGFLARLNEAKVKRGDRTTLAIHSTPNGSRLVSEPNPTG